jgi:uncharacterized protein
LRTFLTSIAVFLPLATCAARADDIAVIDCAKAAALDETAICADPKLRVLDAETSTLYEVRMMVPMLMGERGNARDAQVSFLQTRSACGANTSCIASAYRARIASLNETISGAMNEYCKLKQIC